MKKYKGIIFDSAGLGEASKYSKTTYKLNNFSSKNSLKLNMRHMSTC